MDKVSVIIPVYNAEKRIEGAVQSVIDQTYPEIELIIIDDGSTDDSGRLLENIKKEFINKTPNSDTIKNGKTITIIHDTNHGVSYARNKGMELSSGKYVAFIDADDTVEPNYIERLVAAAGMGRNNSLETDSSKNKDGIELVCYSDKITDIAAISGDYFLEYAVLNSDTHVWDKLFLLESIREKEITFPTDITIGEDMLFLLEFVNAIGRKECIKCITNSGYNYYENAEGAMNRSFKPSYMDQITCWDRAEKILDNRKTELSVYVYVKLAIIQIMAAMLVVGKLACSGKPPENIKEQVDICKAAIRHAKKQRGAFAGLSNGYKMKVIFLMGGSSLYLRSYGKWKGN